MAMWALHHLCCRTWSGAVAKHSSLPCPTPVLVVGPSLELALLLLHLSHWFHVCSWTGIELSVPHFREAYWHHEEQLLNRDFQYFQQDEILRYVSDSLWVTQQNGHLLIIVFMYYTYCVAFHNWNTSKHLLRNTVGMKLQILWESRIHSFLLNDFKKIFKAIIL